MPSLNILEMGDFRLFLELDLRYLSSFLSVLLLRFAWQLALRLICILIVLLCNDLVLKLIVLKVRLS